MADGVKFKVVTPVASRAATEFHNTGDVVTKADLSHADINWLLKSGAIVPHGHHGRGVELLGDNPTPDQFREEIARMQGIIEELGEENDKLKAQQAEAANKRFPTGPQAHAADNAAVKMREAEARVRDAEKEVKELREELDDVRASNTRLVAENDRLTDRVTELEAEARKAADPKPADGKDDKGEKIPPKGGSGTAPPKDKR